MLSTGVLCIKKRKKRSYCVVTSTTNHDPTCTEKTKRTAGGGPTMLQITEDTPPDMLAGAMDLTVHLPTGRSVKMSVERSTPMMDLLVQITTNYHLQLSGYTLQALGMAPSNAYSDTVLPYKPNTPIGALDTQHIRVIPKSKSLAVPKNVPPGQLPFESTFRLKVHLPRNQLYVTRVTQNVRLDDIMKKVCDEKNLDCHKYEFRHPANLDEILDPGLTLNDYAITEIYLVQRGSGMTQAFSTGDIMTLRKEEDKKQTHNRPASGMFNLIFRRGKSSTGSLSSDNRSISPTHSEDSRSVTPPGVPQHIITPPQPEQSTERPKPPQRKRRPAPKPPQDAASSTGDLVSTKPDPALTICHSRNSSDSSGYHEASILSENASLPRRPKSTMIMEESQKPLLGLHSQSTSNLSKMSSHSKSTSSLAAPSRKKKSAPPPPPQPVLKADISENNHQEASPLIASQTAVVQTESTASMPPIVTQPTPVDSLGSVQSLPSSVVQDQKPEKKEEAPKEIDPVVPEPDWQYQLPSPPKAFRDSSPVSFSFHESVADSVVTSPELFEKLKTLNKSEKDTTSSVVSEDDKPILNKLSLENLEKRKSLVYNRELATSLKHRNDPFAPKERSTETFANSLTNFERVYDEVKKSSPKQVISATSTLPNFKITTYNNPKQKLDIFEDDTVRSNTERAVKRNSFAEASRPDENIFIRKMSADNTSNDHVYKFYRAKEATKPSFPVFRSESFSRNQTWIPSKPVTRSKSHISLNKHEDRNVPSRTEDSNLTKSNSLFDVSGLQSLEVMRSIQNKLKTPVESREEITNDQKQTESRSEVQNYARTYRPPSINMGTWSERPKVPVNVKEDPDYKYGVKTVNSAELLVNTINTRNNFEVRNKIVTSNHGNGISVRVDHENSSAKDESITKNSSEKVIIKIGQTDKPVFRKPLGNVNTQRPHSIAFASEFDMSRVPFVRSVELKKPYKDNNTSTTQINTNGYAAKTYTKPNAESKPAFRPNSYLHTIKTPVVKGFRSGNEVKTMGWNQPHSFTLQKMTDRKTEPPKAPVLPKFEPVKSRGAYGDDPKEQLLQAIRDFGGKKGLRAVKA